MKVLALDKKRSKDYKAGYEYGFKRGVFAAVKVNYYGVIQYLGDKRGWRRESIFEALRWCRKHLEMMQDKDITSLEEVEASIKEEYGIVWNGSDFELVPDWTPPEEKK